MAGALKQAGLYDRVTACERHSRESLGAYTRRFAATFARGIGGGRTADAPRDLLLNEASCLHDGAAHGAVECLALPALAVAVVLRLVGPPVVIGAPDGVAAVAAALAAAGVAFCIE